MPIEKLFSTEIYYYDFLFHLTLILVTFFCFIIIGYCYLRYKKHIYRLVKKQNNLEDNLLCANLSLQKQKQTIRKMEADSKRISQAYISDATYLKSVISGIHIYLAVLRNENISQLNSNDLLCFIKCYKEIDESFAKWIEKHNVSLTNRELTICIFIRMGKVSRKF